MENILLQLYNGEIYPSDQYRPQLKEHIEARQENLRRYEEFAKVLEQRDPILKAQFREVMDRHAETAPYEICETFIDGFRLGAKIMLAVPHEP